MDSQFIDHRVIAHLKYDDEVARDPSPESFAVTTGVSLLASAKTLADGRTIVTASVSERLAGRRASGRIYRSWTPVASLSVRRTKDDLVIARWFDPKHRTVDARHLFARDELTQVIRSIQGLFRGRLHELAASAAESGHELRVLEGPEPTEVLSAAVDPTIARDAAAHIGPIAPFSRRFPLVVDAQEKTAPSTYMPWLDAQDTAQVAKNLFGITRYRRPLAHEITRLGPGDHLTWFSLFRGLVPIDWIIDAMRALEMDQISPHALVPMNANERRTIRAILRRTPQPILRRVLGERIDQAHMVLGDAARAVSGHLVIRRDLDALPGLIEARGQKRVRSSRDLEHLVQAIPSQDTYRSTSIARAKNATWVLENERQQVRLMNRYNETVRATGDESMEIADWQDWQDPAFRNRASEVVERNRRALMDAEAREAAERAERERRKRMEREAERAAWAAELTGRLDGLVVGEGLHVVVATNDETLSRWAQLMNNCIDLYSREIGLDVLAAVVDDGGRALLNLQVTREHGLRQILGVNNRDVLDMLGRATGQSVLGALITQGVVIPGHVLGLNGLGVPTTV